MIEINLVPPHMRPKKSGKVMGGFNFPLEIIVGVGGVLFMLLIVMHIVFLTITLGKVASYKVMEKTWSEIEPQKKVVDEIISEMRDIQKKKKQIEEITGERKVYWSKKLNILSDVLPRGVWLSKVIVDRETFIVEGSAISKQKKEMISVHSFTSGLKKEEGFLDNLSGLELGSIQRRKVGTTEIADFLITTKIK